MSGGRGEALRRRVGRHHQLAVVGFVRRLAGVIGGGGEVVVPGRAGVHLCGGGGVAHETGDGLFDVLIRRNDQHRVVAGVRRCAHIGKRDAHRAGGRTAQQRVDLVLEQYDVEATKAEVRGTRWRRIRRGANSDEARIAAGRAADHQRVLFIDGAAGADHARGNLIVGRGGRRGAHARLGPVVAEARAGGVGVIAQAAGAVRGRAVIALERAPDEQRTVLAGRNVETGDRGRAARARTGRGGGLRIQMLHLRRPDGQRCESADRNDAGRDDRHRRTIPMRAQAHDNRTRRHTPPRRYATRTQAPTHPVVHRPSPLHCSAVTAQPRTTHASPMRSHRDSRPLCRFVSAQSCGTLERCVRYRHRTHAPGIETTCAKRAARRASTRVYLRSCARGDYCQI